MSKLGSATRLQGKKPRRARPGPYDVDYSLQRGSVNVNQAVEIRACVQDERSKLLASVAPGESAPVSASTVVMPPVKDYAMPSMVSDIYHDFSLAQQRHCCNS